MKTSREKEEFKYDVAISFLWKDAGLAIDLRDRLAPGLRVFVASRETAEAILGRDGQVAFGDVFRREARLSVVLYREGWGDTEFAAIEESGVKDRAFKTHHMSFMMVRLDDAPIRDWMPQQHLYVSFDDFTTNEIAAVVKARAGEVGAEVKRESAAQAAIRQGREAKARQEREIRYKSAAAVTEVRAELRALYERIWFQVKEVVEESSEKLGVTCEYGDWGCLISSPTTSSTLVYRQRASNHVEGAFLRVAQYDGPAIRVPGDIVGGGRFVSGESFSPHVSDEDRWIWRATRDLEDGPIILISITTDEYSRAEFADLIVGRFFSRLFERD